MAATPVILDFGPFTLDAELFDHPASRALVPHLPVTVSLTQWGGELYGPLPVDPGSHNPVPEIPPGGLAYSQNGRYFCVFFGQTPAWDVDYIGQIAGDSWKQLLKAKGLRQLEIKAA